MFLFLAWTLTPTLTLLLLTPGTSAAPCFAVRWVDPARRWHAFPATFDLFLLRGGFGDASPAAVSAVLQRAVESNATLLLVDSYRCNLNES